MFLIYMRQNIKIRIFFGFSIYVLSLSMLKIRLFLLLTLLLMLAGADVTAQVLRGTIHDSKNSPVPYSTVYVKELRLGSAANQDGVFEIKVPEGKYTCTFQSLGYHTVSKVVEVKTGSPRVDIVLQEMTYDLSTVEIKSGKEDPAYAVIWQVIARAPYFAGLVKSFNAHVYIRGSLVINALSDLVKLMAKEDLEKGELKEGYTYLQESVNEISYRSDGVTEQRVVSIKSSFPEFFSGEGGNSDALGFISGNIYVPDGFAGAYSPIYPGSFSYYRFRHEGKTKHDSYSVHKIAVEPLGKGAQYISGTLYIIDSIWCISDIDIVKDSQLGVSLSLMQHYNAVRQGTWLPVTNRLKVEMNLLGNSGSFVYNTSIRYDSLALNINEPAPVANRKDVLAVDQRKQSVDKVNHLRKQDEDTINHPRKQSVDSINHPRKLAWHNKMARKIMHTDEKIAALRALGEPGKRDVYKLSKLQQKRTELVLKDSLRFDHRYTERYIITYDSNARKQDSSFWNRIRPIPLLPEEQSSLQAYDSAQLMQQAKVGDTVNGVRKRASWPGSLVMGGNLFRDSLNTLRTRGLINPFGVSYDVVDGWSYQTNFGYTRITGKHSRLLMQPMVGYAFARKAIMWEMLVKQEYDRSKGSLGLRFGQKKLDFNTDGIHPLESMIEGLIFRENPARFYHATYAEFRVERNLINDFSFSAGVYAADNEELKNYSDYSFFFRESKDFDPNNAVKNNQYTMSRHQELTTELVLKYRFVPYYYYKDGIRVARHRFNDTPEFSLGWKRAIKVGVFDARYDLVRAVINHQKNIGMHNKLSYRVEAGYFVNSDSMWFTQFQHFAKRPLIAGIKEFFPYFLMLDSYEFSTNEHYAVAHVQYKSPFIVLKRLPFVRNRLWQESLFLSYLYSPQHKNYLEPGYGIGNMFYNVGVFAGFEALKFRQVGLRFSITILGTKEISL